jgi:uroporphyrinogen III methyltransferase / synthase
MPPMSDTTRHSGLVVLVGAGPGVGDLITLQGLRWLRRADVVIYDRLAGRALLGVCPRDAERIDVGKTPGRPGATQEQINDLLVKHCRAGRLVVRLKGGDPLVFGRGAEEAQALREASLPYRIVPGVTAASAAAAFAGIPLTDRRLASSVTLATGREDPSKMGSSLDWKALGGVDTLVLYMGVGTLGETTSHLLEAGRDPETPVAIVERAGSPTQRTTTGTLASIVEKATDAGVRAPAIIVIGEVVSLRERIEWYEHLALFGKTVLVTRPAGQAHSLVEGLRELGAEVIEAPAIEITAMEDPGDLDAALVDLGKQDWLALTSPNGVAAVFDRLEAIGGDSRHLAPVKVAAVGSATARALADHGIRADLIPAEYTTTGLGEAVASLGEAEAAERRILLARADIATAVLPRILRAAGWKVSEVVAYRTRPASCLPEDAKQALDEGRVDWVTFTSASTVRGFLAIVGDADLTGVRFAAIGPATEEAMGEAGLTSSVVARPHTPEALIDAIASAAR